MDEKRLCLISIIIEDRESVPKVNAVLSDFNEGVLGRLGLPLKERGCFVITIIADADAKLVNSVTGKLGMLPGVSAKTLMR